MVRAPITAEMAFDQVLIAFGSGTGGIYVKADVSNNLKQMFHQNFVNRIQQNPSVWDTEKLYVLECSRSIGRLAALNAVSRGSMAITWEDTQPAVASVVNRYQGPLPGPWCHTG